jgi:hypothetical protein
MFHPTIDSEVEINSHPEGSHPLPANLNPSESPSREGKISRIGMIPGTLYVVENGSQRTYGINLHTMAGYRGETLKALGFRVGAHVRFQTAADQQTVTAAQAISLAQLNRINKSPVRFVISTHLRQRIMRPDLARRRQTHHRRQLLFARHLDLLETPQRLE